MSINEGEQNIRNGLAILSFNIPPPLRNVKEFIKLSLNSSADNLMSDKIFKLRLASSDERRAQAYELLQKKFSVPDNSAAFLRLKENPQRISLLIDMKDTPVGTITIVFDSRLGLDADHLFKNELDLLRERGAKLSEITNLAMDGAPKGRRVMAAFVNMAYISVVSG